MTIVDNSLFLEKNYKSKTTYSEKNPNKKIISIETDEKENVIKETYQSNVVIFIEYDEFNNIISETWFQEDKDEIVYSEKYKFDFYNNGQLRKSYFAKFDGPQTNSNWQIIEEYDQEGNITSIAKDFEGDGNIDFVEEYNSVLGYRRKTIFNAKGEIINIQYYEYDLDGTLQSVTYDRNGDGKVEYEKNY